MLRNYFRTAWRNLISNKFYTGINIMGLTIGLVVSIFLMIWVRDELSFDRFHKNEKNIYKIGIIGGTGISRQIFEHIIPTVVTFAKNELPEVKDGVRIMNIGDAPFKYKDKIFLEENFAFTDPSYFSVFDFPLIRGDQKNPFPDNNSLVLTASAAKRYFGNEDPIGKVVTMGQDEQCKVTGVIADYPANSTFKYHVLLPMSRFNYLAYTKQQKSYDGKTVVPSMDVDWISFNFDTYLQLRPGADPVSLEKKLQAIHERNKPDDKPVPYVALPLSKMHLYKMDGSDGGIAVVRIFAAVAIMLLIIACINYVNLSTARSLLRAKEVSVRKIIGAGRLQLFMQFVIETVSLFMIAVVLALGLLYILLPYFNQLSGKEIRLGLSDPGLWWSILVTLLGTLIAASIYPALLLSSFEPLKALKGKLAGSMGNTAFRRGLVVIQFAISITLIISTLVIGRQLSYIRNKNLGYDKENIFSFAMRPAMQQHFTAVKNELMKSGGVTAVTRVNRDMITGNGSSTGDNDWDGKPVNSNTWFNQLYADETTINFFKIQLMQGAGFTGSVADSAHFIINETAAKEMGLKDPVGKRLRIQTVRGTIIGVVKDFHFMTIHKKIEPVVLQYAPNDCWRIYIKTTNGEAPKAIAAAQSIWKEYNNDIPFRYSFLDDSYNELYAAEQREGSLFNLFSVIAILISCLGLLGLATYTAQVKTREVGIRKVLGASVAKIIWLLASEFLALICAANIIAIPAGWYAMNNWLKGFAYKTTITAAIFIIAGIAAIVIALIVVSSQAVKAARANPVKALRSE